MPAEKAWHTVYGTAELADGFTAKGETLSVGDACYAMNPDGAPGWRPLERSYPVSAGSEWWVWRLRSAALGRPVGVILTPAGAEDPRSHTWTPDGAFMMEVGQITFSTETDPVSRETYEARRAMVAERDPEGFLAVGEDEIMVRVHGDHSPRVSTTSDAAGNLSAITVMTCPFLDALSEVVARLYPARPEVIAEALEVPVAAVNEALAEDAAEPWQSFTRRNDYIGPHRWSRPVPSA